MVISSLNQTNYYLFTTKLNKEKNKEVLAEIVEPNNKRLVEIYQTTSLKEISKILNNKNIKLEFTVKINSKSKQYDTYFNYQGHNIYSEKLINLLTKFNISGFKFPVKLIDENGDTIHLKKKYYIFEPDLPVINAMDPEKSGWLGNYDEGVSRLVLKPNQSNWEHMFVCDHLFVTLMSSALKNAILKNKITGFAYLNLSEYKSGNFGFPPSYHD